MELLQEFIELFLHLDTHLQVVIQEHGPWTYLLLFLILFTRESYSTLASSSVSL